MAVGLLDKGYGRSQDLPRHGVGGGGFGDGSYPGRIYGPWTEHSGGSMNTKGELPDLPADSSPLQFGDWLHLITPIMKDISASADWWWESTLREAKVFYENWRTSSPLQRIQIQPRLPEDMQSSQFQRTEQRGIQMLLKAIPSTEQQALVTDRILSSTGIIFKLLVRFQPGGPGEKQTFADSLDDVPQVQGHPRSGISTEKLETAFWPCVGSGSYTSRWCTPFEETWTCLNRSWALWTIRRHSGFLRAAWSCSWTRSQHSKAFGHSANVFLQRLKTLALFQSSTTTTTDQSPLKLKQMQNDPKNTFKNYGN